MSEHPGVLSINIHFTVQLQGSKKLQIENIFNMTVLFTDAFLREIPGLQTCIF